MPEDRSEGLRALAGLHMPAIWVLAAAVIGAATLAGLAPSGGPGEAAPVAGMQDAPSFPLEIGTVERIVDGDTYVVRLRRTGETTTVRLAWLDTPERNQPFGPDATRWAEAGLLGRQVVLTPQAIDRYGRTVAQVSVREETHIWDAAATLARQGLGWVDPRHGEAHEGLLEDQARARADGIGLWSAADPVAPWEWRQRGDGARPAAGRS